MTPEGEVSEDLKKFMVKHGWRPIRNQRTKTPKGFTTGEAGMPDFLFLRYLKGNVALALWIEVKAPGGKASDAQKTWIHRERARGALVMVVDDVAKFAKWYGEAYGWLATAPRPEPTHALYQQDSPAPKKRAGAPAKARR
jgi:hypothetical protein